MNEKLKIDNSFYTIRTVITSLTESGLTAGLSKRGFKPKKKTLKEIVLFDPNEEGSDDDEEVLLEKRESSHDFD